MEEEEKEEERRRRGGEDKGSEEKANGKDRVLFWAASLSLSPPGYELKANYSIPAWVLSLSLILLSTA